MKRKLLGLILVVVSLLCLAIAPACTSGGDQGDGGNNNPPVETYYDEANPGSAGALTIDGSLVETRWRNTNAYEYDATGVSISAKATYSQGLVFGVVVNANNLYINKDNLSNSSAIKIRFSSAENSDASKAFTLTVLKDGQNRLEKNGEKVVTTSKTVATKVSDGKVSFEIYLSWTDLGLSSDNAVCIDYAYVSPNNEQCSSSTTVCLNGSAYYQANNPSTWLSHYGINGYTDYYDGVGNVILNTQRSDVTVEGDGFTYTGTDLSEFFVKNFSDTANKVQFTVKAGENAGRVGIKYGDVSFGIVKQNGTYKYNQGNAVKALTESEITALTTTGITIYTAYYNGVLYAYSEVDGELSSIFDTAKNPSNLTEVACKLYAQGDFTISSVKTGVSAYKIKTNNSVLSYEIDGNGYEGNLKVTVSTDGINKLGVFTVNGVTVNGFNLTSTTVEIGELKGFVIEVNSIVEKKSFTIKVCAVAGASKEWNIPVGTEVTLSLGTSSYKSTIDADGVVSFVDIPYGNYIISIDGYRPLNFFVGKSVVQKVAFTYEIFSSDKSDWTVSLNQQEIKVTDKTNRLGLKFNDVHDNFIMTFRASSLAPYNGTIESLINTTDKKYLMNSGLFMNYANINERFTMNLLTWWNDGSSVFGFKSQRNGNSLAGTDFSEELWQMFNSSGIEVMIIKAGSCYSMYVKDILNKYIFVGGWIADVTVKTMEFNYYDNPILNITEFAYVPNEIYKVENNVTVLKSDFDNIVHGTIDVKTEGLGTEYEIRITPDDGFVPTLFTINGVSKLNEITNGVYSMGKLTSVINNIVVKFDKKLTITGKVTSDLSSDTAYKLIQLYKEDDPSTSFSAITDANGNYTIESSINNGTYIVEGYDLGGLKINITKEILNSGVLNLHFVQEYRPNPVWTVNGNDLTFNNLTAGTSGSIEFNSNKAYTYVEAVMYNPLTTGGAGGLATAPTNEKCGGKIRLTYADGVSASSWGLVYNVKQNDFNVRFIPKTGSGLSWHQWTLSSAQKNLLNSTGLKLAVIVTDSYIYGLIDDGNGNLVLMSDNYEYSKKPNNASCKIIGATGIASNIPYAVFTDVKVSHEYEVPTNISATTHGTAEIIKNNLGDLQIKFTPDSGYVVSNVIVNGVIVDSYIKDNLLVYEYSDLETADISVSFVKSYSISGTLTGDNGNNTFKVYKNTLVTLIGIKTYQTYVGENGSYSFTNLPSDDYVLQVGTAVLSVISVTSDLTSADFVLYYSVENDPYALTYTDQTVEVYGEISGDKFVVTSKFDYDTSKYYSNSKVIAGVADPFVIQVKQKDSEYYGKYVLYGTTSASTGFGAYISDDLVNWEKVGLVFEIKDGWENGYLWAPEVIFDANADRAKLGLGEGKGVYYMFYSSMIKDNSMYSNCMVLGLGISTSPVGPFVRYVGYDSLGRYIDRNTPWMNVSKVCEVLAKQTDINAFHNIDPTPFVDPKTGDYYLYMTKGKGCKMLNNDWSQIDYNSFRQLLSETYQDLESNVKYKTTTNEGPQVTYNPNNGKYYMMVSVQSYTSKDYTVILLVSDSPLGNFRKLNASEGGIFLSSVYGESDNNQQSGQEKDLIPNVSGPGHHAMFYADGQMYIIYHRHEYVKCIDDGEWYYPNVYGKPESAYRLRYVAIDKVEWVKNSNGLEVLAIMGPTSSVQPNIYETGTTKYDNIISDATVTVDNTTVSSNLTALTDNMLLTYDATSSYIKEFIATDKVTIKINFADYRQVTGLSVYNSKYHDKIFESIERVEFDCIIDNKISTTYAYDIIFPTQYYDDDLKQVNHGSASVIDFNEMLVKEIRITIDVRNGNSCFGVGEIIVLGVPNN